MNFMDQIKKNYDVAISFLSEDEAYAKNLYLALQSRLEVFYYAAKQLELVSKDGEAAFGDVFRDKALVVVIFYRTGWGETTMTRAERSAIKQRAQTEGYGFTVWVPVGDDKSIPSFIDPQFLWYDIDRWGIEGLAAIVEKRVQESGCEVRPENIQDQLKKVGLRIDLENKRKAFEWSPEGVAFVQKEINQFDDLVKKKIDEYRSVHDEIKFQIESESNRVVITSWPYRAVLLIKSPASNTIRKTSLEIYLDKIKGNKSYDPDWTNLVEYNFKPTLDDIGEPSWFRDESYYDLNSAISIALNNMAIDVYKAFEKRISER
jgi:hypothetical protein